MTGLVQTLATVRLQKGHCALRCVRYRCTGISPTQVALRSSGMQTELCLAGVKGKLSQGEEALIGAVKPHIMCETVHGTLCV